MGKDETRVIIFSIAFAFIEAATVVYLRHLIGSIESPDTSAEILFLVPGIAFLEPQAAVKIITDSEILNIEKIREAATLVMLGTVAMLAAKKIKEQIAYFFLAFGVWDIFYYIFLKLTIGWPQSIGDLDIFFLLPTPWVGPVFVPILISLFLITGSVFYLSLCRPLEDSNDT
ncbi:hypothetical protein A2870_00390 [Candidatus Curtissbacteria bacterium RIFCSPHIGHO2_01_FULL_41_11]|uniref:Uncharacterized protein n=1 Tax=Candidatus Curtissbacteria bacterium RIFCSPHIGHO2_01_FULL_41_11 TaxID=1797711 RepID=A0A1F5G517_9BACT|nr:MAG: hypothetical protein A2870_00390 [Candidatus Curtissbacteria bacterium RIFCSPHIGHO2_01_FULL_41_11]